MEKLSVTDRELVVSLPSLIVIVPTGGFTSAGIEVVEGRTVVVVVLSAAEVIMVLSTRRLRSIAANSPGS
jgi:hypothetical protein